MIIHNYNFAGDNEMVINFTEGSKEIALTYTEGGHASMTTSIRRFITKAKKLEKTHPNEVNLLTNEDGSVFMTFPADWIKFPAPKKKVSDENKAKAAERMKAARQKKEKI